jgi:hypothetical protein
MRRLRQVAWALMTLAVLFFGVFLGLVIAHRESDLHFANTVTVVRQVQALSDLVTVKYVMQKVELADSPPPTLLGKFVQGDNKVLLLAQGVVKAGIDLKKISPDDVTISGKTVTITLPRPEITDAYLDDSQTMIIERSTGFLRALDKDLEQKTRQNAVDDIRRAAQTAGILNEANERARAELRAFLLQTGFESVDFR